MSQEQSEGTRRFRLIKDKVRSHLTLHENLYTVLFFVLGLAYDALTLSQPGDGLALVQQVVFILILGIILFLESLHEYFNSSPSAKILKLWPYKNFVSHFIIGSLLSLYSLYYIKSASLAGSLIFLLLILSLLVLNEVPRFKAVGLPVRWGLFSLIVLSFFLTAFPLFLGRVNWLSFLLALVTHFSVLFLLSLWIQKKGERNKAIVVRKMWSAYLVLGLFFIFYALKWLPPVPLSLMKIGVYHGVGKDSEANRYILYQERSQWKFWQNGDQDFYARPNEKIYLFSAVYSPAEISDTIYMNWMKWSKQSGWTSWQRIPFTVQGGRKEGFRGYTYKTNYEPGKWRVLVETEDGREIGRVHFDVSLSNEPLNLYPVHY